MSFLQWAGMGIFGGILAAIVFVKAGQWGGANGGEQSAAMIGAAGGSAAKVITAVEGGNVGGGSL